MSSLFYWENKCGLLRSSTYSALYIETLYWESHCGQLRSILLGPKPDRISTEYPPFRGHFFGRKAIINTDPAIRFWALYSRYDCVTGESHHFLQLHNMVLDKALTLFNWKYEFTYKVSLCPSKSLKDKRIVSDAMRNICKNCVNLAFLRLYPN